MLKFLISMTFFSLLFSCSTLAYNNLEPVNSSSEKERVLLTVAIEDVGYYPFNYNENGIIKGFSIDVLNYFEANSQYDFEFIITPWPRILFLVSQGKVDLILTLFKSEEREKKYHFIEPAYANEANQFFTLAENNITFSGQLEELTSYSIGTNREYSYGEYFDQADYLNKLPALTEPVLLKLLLGKRIDMLIGNPLAFNHMISQKNLSAKVKAIKPFVEITPVHMALTKKRQDAQEIKNTLEQLTKQLKSTPYYQELLSKYQLNFK